MCPNVPIVVHNICQVYFSKVELKGLNIVLLKNGKATKTNYPSSCLLSMKIIGNSGDKKHCIRIFARGFFN